MVARASNNVGEEIHYRKGNAFLGRGAHRGRYSKTRLSWIFNAIQSLLYAGRHVIRQKVKKSSISLEQFVDV